MGTGVFYVTVQTKKSLSCSFSLGVNETLIVVYKDSQPCDDQGDFGPSQILVGILRIFALERGEVIMVLYRQRYFPNKPFNYQLQLTIVILRLL